MVFEDFFPNYEIYYWKPNLLKIFDSITFGHQVTSQINVEYFKTDFLETLF